MSALPQIKFDQQLMRDVNKHCSPKRHDWEKPAYCECGQEIEKVLPKDKMAEILKSGEVERECPNCGMTVNLQFFVKQNAIDWGDLYKVWQLNVDIFPAVEFEEYVY